MAEVITAAKPDAGSIKWIPTGKIGVKNNGPKVLSRYLKAPTGSCHDFCKYGIKHDFEAKEKSRTPKRLTAALDEGQYLEKSPTLAKKKKKKVLSCMASPSSKPREPDKLRVVQRDGSSSANEVAISEDASSSPFKEMAASTIHSNDSKLNPLATKSCFLSTQESISIKRNSYSRKSKKREAQSPLGDPSIQRNGESETAVEIRASKLGEREVCIKPRVSSSPKVSVRRTSNQKAGGSKNLRGISRLKNRNNAEKAVAVEVSYENVPEKTIYIIEPEAGNEVNQSIRNGNCTAQPLPSLGTSSEDNGLRHTHYRSKRSKSSLSPENKYGKHTRKRIHMTQPPPLLSLSFEKKSFRQNWTCANPLSSSSLPPLPSFVSPSDSTLSEESGTISEHNQTKTDKQMSISKFEYKGRPRRGVISGLEDKNRPPRKLQFRRGKVVDLQVEDNSPRRLKFRQKRVLGDSYNGQIDIKRRWVRRREVIEGELNGTNAKSEKVVLRHQYVKGKKIAQSLFNNMIEETASKLVQTRNSKVKALVGAFETIISLQEAKPPAVTSIC